MLKTLRQCRRTICSHAAWSPARQRWISVSMASGWADEVSTDMRRNRAASRRSEYHGPSASIRSVCFTVSSQVPAVNQAFLQHTPDGFRVESVTAAAVAAALGTPCYVYSAGGDPRRLPAPRRRVRRAPARHPLRAQGQLHAGHGAADALARQPRRRQLDGRGRRGAALRLRAARHRLHRASASRPAELARAVTLDVHAINVESPGELDRLDQLAVAARPTRRAWRCA